MGDDIFKRMEDDEKLAPSIEDLTSLQASETVSTQQQRTGPESL